MNDPETPEVLMDEDKGTETQCPGPVLGEFRLCTALRDANVRAWMACLMARPATPMTLSP